MAGLPDEALDLLRLFQRTDTRKGRAGDEQLARGLVEIGPGPRTSGASCQGSLTVPAWGEYDEIGMAAAVRKGDLARLAREASPMGAGG